MEQRSEEVVGSGSSDDSSVVADMQNSTATRSVPRTSNRSRWREQTGAAPVAAATTATPGATVLNLQSVPRQSNRSRWREQSAP